MRSFLTSLVLLTIGVLPLSGSDHSIPVQLSGFICADPGLAIPPEGRLVQLTLENRRWQTVASARIRLMPGQESAPWQILVPRPGLFPGRLTLRYNIDEASGCRGQGWWSPEGTVYDRRAAGQILLGNGRQSHIRICLLHGIAIHGRVFLPADVSAARQPVGIRLVDQSGRSRGIRWYRPVPKTRSVDWSRSWPPQTAPERVRIAVIMGSGNKRITLWARGTGLTSDPALADEYALAGKHPVCLIFP